MCHYTLLINFDFNINYSAVLTDSILFKIYNNTSQLPENWNNFASENTFLTVAYLSILEQSAPQNMRCHFIGLFKSNQLVGIALAQFLNANHLESFGERDRCYKTKIRNFIFKNFASHVLFIGNNMLTGQNAFAILPEITIEAATKSLQQAAKTLTLQYKENGIPIHLITFKDFSESESRQFCLPDFKKYFLFSIQPNMVFACHENWKSDVDYTNALSKKYRDQYKRARKKALGVEKRKLHLDEIIAYEETIYELYLHVAKNAPFNTFFLEKNHFRVFKEKLKDQFLFYGYFMEKKLVGFNTLIKNGNGLDTYFLGYDESIQRDKMLYLNMLYDMIAYAIHKGFKEIIFARTALEIKSSVGAKPVKMYGFINHTNILLNLFMPIIFSYLEPESVWQQRNPFKLPTD
ncbi:MAG: GNAT family N-acetyltransferase [Burkholderiales bacterium]|nr:GNAT family N-acetyltransferase [Flavobacterium sp.]